MDLLIRIIAFILTHVGMLINWVLEFMQPRKSPSYPPIRNPILNKSVIELVTELRRGQVREIDFMVDAI